MKAVLVLSLCRHRCRALNIRSQPTQIVYESGIPTVDVTHAVNLGETIRDQTREHKTGSRADICRLDRSARETGTPTNECVVTVGAYVGS